jgi:hypothetical protein
MQAKELQIKNVNYIVKDNEILIVDEFTGRTMPGRRWSDGLHQVGAGSDGLRQVGAGPDGLHLVVARPAGACLLSRLAVANCLLHCVRGQAIEVMGLYLHEDAIFCCLKYDKNPCCIKKL